MDGRVVAPSGDAKPLGGQAAADVIVADLKALKVMLKPTDSSQVAIGMVSSVVQMPVWVVNPK